MAVSFPSHGGLSLAEQSKQRFAIGTFDGWPQVREGLREFRARGLVLDSFNCLALERLFSGKTILAPDHEFLAVRALPFPSSSELVALHIGSLGQLPDGAAGIRRS